MNQGLKSLRQTMQAVRQALTCQTCGKSIMVAATKHRGHGTGQHGSAYYGATSFERVTTATHCTCPGGPCAQAGLLPEPEQVPA